MNQSKVNLLDIPDEILLIILKNLNSIDVLYSLLDINNGRLNIIAQDKTFSNILKFVSIDNISFIDRFCIDILPRINHHVKCFIFDSNFMERILCTTNYPNLTELRILHFRQELALNYLTNESPLRGIFQEQITSLSLINNDQHTMIDSLENYTINVYTNLLNFFKNLKHLFIYGRSIMSYPGLSLSNLPSTTFFSPILTHLHINVNTLDDCLYLLDGRLKQLTTLSVNIYSIDSSLSIVHDTNNLPNLTCFSLKSFMPFKQYDKIVSLLRRMSHLEELTLYLSVEDRNKIVDGTDIENDILHYMPQLHSFTFYICTHLNIDNLLPMLSQEDIQQSLTNFKEEHVTSILNYASCNRVYGSLFSLPFVFDYLPQLGNTFPNVIFSCVTILDIQDVHPFKHEFFNRIARSFPILKSLRIFNWEAQASYGSNTILCDNSQSYSIIEYLHLISLDLRCAHGNYIEQFLTETKAFVPSLRELKVDEFQLKVVTNFFGREDTRRNCAKINRLFFTLKPIELSRKLSLYFPSLAM